jgi:hypothetical protein
MNWFIKYINVISSIIEQGYKNILRNTETYHIGTSRLIS